MVTLAARVQALPQELYDEILELTLTTDEHIAINEDYKPPVQLQINRATRRATKISYYANTKFHVGRSSQSIFGDCLDPCLSSLDESTRQQVRVIRVDTKQPVRFREFGHTVGPECFRCDLSKSLKPLVENRNFITFKFMQVLHFLVAQDEGEGQDTWMSCANGLLDLLNRGG